ncbi:hypothetical protein ABVG11_36285 [Streptomyces sp. HD1123-B1]
MAGLDLCGDVSGVDRTASAEHPTAYGVVRTMLSGPQGIRGSAEPGL